MTTKSSPGSSSKMKRFGFWEPLLFTNWWDLFPGRSGWEASGLVRFMHCGTVLKRRIKLFVQLAPLVFPLALRADLPSSVEIKHKSRDLNKVQEEINRKRHEQEVLKKEAS